MLKYSPETKKQNSGDIAFERVFRCIFVKGVFMLKKITAAILSALLIVTCAGCSSKPDPEGCSDIKNARKLYSELYSAQLTVTDEQSDTVTQELTFRYDSQDNLNYSYYGTDGNTVYYEYHNGSEYNYFSDGEWHTLVSGDENYVCYSRSRKMSMTDEGMIFIKPESVTSSKVTETADGKTIEMEYDAAALNSSMASQLGLVGELESFRVIYTLDSDGYCTSMEQIGTAVKDGTESKVDYLMTIEHMNDIASIEQPEIKDKEAASESKEE